MTHVIAQPCEGCKDAACVEVCPVDCIRTDADAPAYYIDGSECIDCGACTPVCPVEAIFQEEELPAKWAGYKEINEAYFRKA